MLAGIDGGKIRMNGRMNPRKGFPIQYLLVMGLSSGACSENEIKRRSPSQSSPQVVHSEDAADEKGATQPKNPATIKESEISEVRATPHPEDEVVHTFVVGVQPRGYQLVTNDQNLQMEWSVDMEERSDIQTEVAADKYLRISGQLIGGEGHTDQTSRIGCLQIELFDNVNYGVETILNLSTTGITGLNYPDLTAKLLADMQPFTEVPMLPDALNLARFSSMTVKRFNHEVCFALDYSDLPSDTYSGQVVVQYLKPHIPVNDDDSGASPVDEHEAFSCATLPQTLKANQELILQWNLPEENLDDHNPLSISLKGDLADLGRVEPHGQSGAFYEAPSSIAKTTKVFVVASKSGYLDAFCEVTLQGDEDFGVEDDGEIEGLVGNVYPLPPDTPSLPDFSQLTPVSRVVMGQVDIPERRFQTGFPGVADLYEWFGVQLRGQIIIPSDGSYDFNLVSDDGSRLFIDGQEVIDNDGLHPTRSRSGSIYLTEGTHDIHIDYFQGPRYYITLQLFWRMDGTGPYEIVSHESFVRPLE